MKEPLEPKLLRQLTKPSSLILEKSFTRRGHVFLGTRCSYRCKFCYGNGKRNESFFSKEKIKKYIDFLYAYGIRTLEYTGGEPTEDEDLLSLVHYARKKYNLRQAIITNGSADISLYKDLYKEGVSEFLFSFHGYNEESHKKITCVSSSWEKINKAMSYIDNKDVLLRVNITICKYNYKHLLEQAHYLIENYKSLFMVNYLPMNSWDNSTIYQDVSVPYKEYTDSFPSIISLFKENDVQVAIRYIPYCVLPNEVHPYVYQYIHHAYDEYDWNQELDGKTIRKEYLNYPYGYYTIESILNKRELLYTKFKSCLSCEYFHLCDGFQKKQVEREKDI